MKYAKRLRITVFVLLVCILLSSCVPANPHPSETDPTVPSTSFFTPPEDTTPDPDTVLDVTSLTLASLGSKSDSSFILSYVLIVPGADGAEIYRFWESWQYPSNYDCGIDYYETDTLTPEFFHGGSVAVRSAIRNAAHRGDHRTFGDRLFHLSGASDVSYVSEIWATGNTILLYSSDNATFITLDIDLLEQGSLDFESPDKGLVQFMLLIYADRGTRIRHFP